MFSRFDCRIGVDVRINSQWAKGPRTCKSVKSERVCTEDSEGFWCEDWNQTAPIGASDSENDSACNAHYGYGPTCCAASRQPFSGVNCRSKMGAKSISMEKSDFFNLISGSVLFLYFWWNCKKTGIVFDNRWLCIQWFIEDLDKTRTRSDSGSPSFSESVRDQMYPDQIWNLTGMTF